MDPSSVGTAITGAGAEPLSLGPASRVRFDRFVLDRTRGCLMCDGAEVSLRPKTFAVLGHLVENSGRLVSKDELFAAVWPGLAVTDDTLVQSVGELRRALGKDGPRLIRTVPRRGYRLESAVAPVSMPATDDPSDSTANREENEAPIQAAAPSPPVSAMRRWSATKPVTAALVTLLTVGLVWIGFAGGWRTLMPSGAGAHSGAELSESAEKPTIAVLPFADLSGDTTRLYLVDGLTQDLIDALGRFSELTVMSWNAVLPYREKPASPAAVSRALAVRYQVEGNIRRSGDSVRVDARLIDAVGQVLWSDRFDRPATDLLSLQDRIAAEIAGTLAVRVTRAERQRAFAEPPKNLEAYDLVLRARPALRHPERGSVAAARALLRHAIELDPNFAAAYAGLAQSYYIAVSMGWAEEPARFLGQAAQAATKALEIDDTDVRAHVVLGRTAIFYHRYAEALAEMDRAIAINPNDARAIAGRGNALMWTGQTDNAIAALEAARHLDPDLGPLDRFALSLAYYLKRRYGDAIEEARLNLRKTEGANFSRIVLAAAYAEAGRAEEAAPVVAQIHRLDPTFDPQQFGSKFLSPADLENLRDGLRKAGLLSSPAG
ncbi:MAG TPA: winged helix-turn-helix domain-containing protein [Stellaceae bacterium]|nr:winged helix-turn-helix domain-containing protein [Stellaceae bacterium]